MKRYVKSAVRRVAQYVLGDGAVLAQSTWAGYTRDALQLANIIDCTPKQMQQQQQHPERIAANIEDRVCNWYLPQFDNAFYGGIMTILRLAEYLQRTLGIKQRIIICGAANAAEVSVNITKAFSALSQAEVVVLGTAEAIINIPPSDYSVATLWTTAYVLLGVQNTGYKFYMIQDFEPAFYPAGSTYAQAELSYSFGFYGIANTQSLKEIYERDYGGCAVVLKPTIDKSVFYPSAENKSTSPRRLFYYARPGAPRNAFELAAAALQRLKRKYADGIDIICAGAGWDPADYGLSNVVRTIGMLPYEETANLYRSCHAGFVMMLTKHPSYLPFELMACGAIVVTNFNQANTWLLKDGENCLLSAPSASCLAATLAYALDHYEELAPLRARATKDIFEDSGDWDNSLSEVAKFILEPPTALKNIQAKCSAFVATK
jgi:glycosyltransferase involved in cell wall biosynthesis